jgi:hypothetical protein
MDENQQVIFTPEKRDMARIEYNKVVATQQDNGAWQCEATKGETVCITLDGKKVGGLLVLNFNVLRYIYRLVRGSCVGIGS